MATYQELMARKQALEAQIEEARANEVASVIEQIRGLMTQFGLSPEDIAPRRRRGRPAGAASAPVEKEPLPPKYLDPKTGKNVVGTRPRASLAGQAARALPYSAGITGRPATFEDAGDPIEVQAR